MSSTTKSEINGNSTGTVKKCVGKDSFQRMNYLYQASNATATQNTANNVASVLYSNLMIAISKKAVQRLDVDMKRTICKGCRSLLLAGINCRVRVKKKKLLWICSKCDTRKVFPMHNPDYQLWSQQEGSTVEILDYKS